MYEFVSALIVIGAILLTLIVLVQESKGGGLASNFSSSNQIMGVRKTTDFLEKATWALAGAILFLSVVAAATIPHVEKQVDKSMIQKEIQEAVDPSAMPSFPTTMEEVKTATEKTDSVN